MIKLLIFSLLNINCFLEAMQFASKTELLKNKSNSKELRLMFYKPANKKHLKMLLKQVLKDNKLDERILTLSWMESRMRPFVKRGDKGKACGTFQIHARHSYPMFRRRKGYKNWDPKESKNAMFINAECRKLEKLSYSINTLKKYLKIFDKKKLHICHHNSGAYAKCNNWYKKRVDYWLTYFKMSKLICKGGKDENLWATIRHNFRLEIDL